MEKEYLRLHEVAERYNLSERTIKRLLKAKTFPNGKLVSPKIRMWTNIEIEAWLDERDGDDERN